MIDIEKYTNAILWPANLNEAGPDMPREEADVKANRNFLEDNGAVYWDTSAKRKELRGPFEGYIYNTLPIGKVEWKCIIEFVINRDRLLEMPEEHIYIPDFRKQCLEGHFDDGRKHYPSQNWIKILKFEKLRNPLKLQDFIKLDGTTVKNVRGGFVYIIRP
ncbi:MAG: hypothetical protein OIN86_16710 [Candidatus Methanoperedens sp.]|nr:hypothetical protein [Candidatus Methanoperedens sp.]CAG1003631.1 hypothetical protein METP1_03089 [Methanosarcinales archaeon]